MLQIKDSGGLLAICSDSWKRRAAGQGVPLSNVMVLLPDGGSVFHKVVDQSGECKNAEYIVKKHEEWANEVSIARRVWHIALCKAGP